MTEADILSITYEDLCTVHRPFKELLPTGETVFRKGLEGRLMYTDIPCALSSPTGGKLQRGPPAATVACDYLLFVRPEVDILPGDTVSVQHLGKVLVADAGLASRLSSHNNVPLTLKKESKTGAD